MLVYTKTPPDSSRIDKQSTSKGNQMKWYHNGEFIKKDYLGYESIAEFLAYKLIECSNIPRDLIVPYYICDIHYDGKVERGCFCKSFKKPSQRILPLQQWLEVNGWDIGEFKYSTINSSINALREELKFGEEFNTYMQHMFMLDAVILNEDRHTNNIVFIEEKGKLIPAPYFDHGLSFLSDVRSYPNKYDLRSNINSVKSKPIYETFDKQISIDTDNPLKFDNGKVQEVLDTYRHILGRAAEVLEYQRERYHKIFI